MSVHDEIQEMVPAYVLGALDAEEASRVQVHLAKCAQCSRLFEAYPPVADWLAYAVPLVELPRGLKMRTMQRALRVKAENETQTSVLNRQSWGQGRGFTFALASAALLLVLLASAWNVWQTWQLSQQLGAQRDLLTAIAYTQGGARIVRGTDLAPEAVGRLYVDPDASIAALVAVDMPALSPNQVYQVWFIDPAGHTVSGGTFRIDNNGDGWLLVQIPHSLGAYSEIEVTAESAGRSTAPTTHPVLVGAVNLP